jgi:molecular chaperone GrpE (heat shock protein)
VLDEAQRGYLLGEELLRPASVIVAQRAEARTQD